MTAPAALTKAPQPLFTHTQEQESLPCNPAPQPHTPHLTFFEEKELQSTGSVSLIMRVTGLFVYPIKSCGAIALDEAVITPTGE